MIYVFNYSRCIHLSWKGRNAVTRNSRTKVISNGNENNKVMKCHFYIVITSSSSSSSSCKQNRACSFPLGKQFLIPLSAPSGDSHRLLPLTDAIPLISATTWTVSKRVPDSESLLESMLRRKRQSSCVIIGRLNFLSTVLETVISGKLCFLVNGFKTAHTS